MTDAVRPMTAEEYFSLPETNQIDELIDGEYIVSPPPTVSHQDDVVNACVFLTQICIAWANCRLLPPPFVLKRIMSLSRMCSGFVPDGDCKLVKNRYWEGAPDLVVEVLSPSTAKRDRGVKV